MIFLVTAEPTYMWVAFEIHWAIVIPNIRNPVNFLIKVTTQTGSVINSRYVAIGCFLRHPKAIIRHSTSMSSNDTQSQSEHSISQYY